MVLHVVDAGADEEELVAMTRAVEDVLEEIDAGGSPRMLVLNKADILDDERRRELSFRHPEAVLVSAQTGEGLEELKERVTEEFEKRAQGRRPARAVLRGRPAAASSTTSRARWSARTRPRACACTRACRSVVAERYSRYAVNGQPGGT